MIHDINLYHPQPKQIEPQSTFLDQDGALISENQRISKCYSEAMLAWWTVCQVNHNTEDGHMGQLSLLSCSIFSSKVGVYKQPTEMEEENVHNLTFQYFYAYWHWCLNSARRANSK